VKGFIRKVSVAVVLGVALVSAPASEMAAQRPGPVAAQPIGVGTRVRIFAPSLRRDRYVGQVDSLNLADITLDTAGVRRRLGFEMGPVLVESHRIVSIRTSAIETIEVSAGRAARGSTLRGMLWGGLAGALIIGFGQLPEVNPSAKDFLKYAPVGLAIGAVGGGIVGYALGGERWVPGELPR